MSIVIDWPSVPNPDEDYACDYCEAMPTERHQPTCPLAGPEIYADDLQWCDSCGCSYVTNCACGGSEDR